MEQTNGRRQRGLLRRAADGSLLPARVVSQPVPTQKEILSRDGHDLRSRLNHNSASLDDIGEIWQTQDDIRRQERAKRRMQRAIRVAVRKRRAKYFIKSAKGAFRKFLQSVRNRAWATRRMALVGLAVVFVLVAMIVPASFRRGNQDTNESVPNDSSDITAVAGATTTDSTQQDPGELPIEVPGFGLLYPNGNKSEYSDTVRRISPEGRSPVYVLVDSYEGIRLTVSQQELPESFKGDAAGSVKKMAQDFQALNVLKDGDIDIYHGWTVRDAVHSIITIKRDLLILIRADQKMSDKQIIDYVSALQ